MIDGHGDDVFRYGGKVKVNFSTNIYQGVDQVSNTQKTQQTNSLV